MRVDSLSISKLTTDPQEASHQFLRKKHLGIIRIWWIEEKKRKRRRIQGLGHLIERWRWETDWNSKSFRDRVRIECKEKDLNQLNQWQNVIHRESQDLWQLNLENHSHSINLQLRNLNLLLGLPQQRSTIQFWRRRNLVRVKNQIL